MKRAQEPRRGQITVTVVRGGRPIKQIERPLRLSDEGEAVVYRGKLWPVRAGNKIVIDAPPACAPTQTAAGHQLPNRNSDEATQGVAGGSEPLGRAPSERAPTGAGYPEQTTPPPASDAVETRSMKAGYLVPEHWDHRQRDVIEAAADARLLVDAGPGTGKTAVACRRVAWLIDDCRVAPSNIWLISFTRTAVKEIRNRIHHYLQHPGDLWSVRIATLDSHAWAIQSGFDANASLTGSYEENIARVSKLIRDHEGVFEYLESVEHVLIDEAQDIVGVRADLLVDLVQRLPPACGVTVFADEAQAIYGFARDDDETDDECGGAQPQDHLPGRIRSSDVHRFRETSLSLIYRADTEKLRTLFTEVRQTVLAPARRGGTDRLQEVTDMVRALADQEHAIIKELMARSEDALRGTFILFRRRIDALTAASFWGNAPHRLRMSALPTLVEPWLGSILWDWTARKIKQQDFERLWIERVEANRLASRTPSDAWEQLVKIAGESPKLLSMDVLRARLGRPAPPSDFVRADFGLGGPVFGTIHGCKGREADCVLLMLPASSREDCNHDEEARVVFVGATRARAELRIGKGFTFLASRKVQGAGRAFAFKTINNKPRAQVEFGRQGDLTPEGVAGRSLFSSPDEVLAAHQWLLANVGSIGPAAGKADPNRNWRYKVMPEKGPPVAYLSENVNSDLFSIARDVKERLKWSGRLRPHYGPEHLKIFGACTLVLSPDHPEKERLHEPWATSGFALAPVIQGFDMIYFRTY